MKILVTGASGLIGNQIVDLLKDKNYIVHYLTTSRQKVVTNNNLKGFYWNPGTNEIDINAFEDVEAIINLAGSTIAQRWTSSNKKEIIASRVNSVNLLFDTLAKTPNRVKQIISASAIGVYPDSLDLLYTEDLNHKNNSFLANVVNEWERSVDQFSSLNITVCKLRIGLVLSNDGGALPQIIKPIKYGLGSIFGTGKQFQSWIHINDLAKMFVFAIENKLNGVYNAVAPNPVTHRKMMFTIARLLSKPLYFPNTPKIIMKLFLGEMHLLLFESQNVSSKKIESAGFEFQFNLIEEALKNILLDK